LARGVQTIKCIADDHSLPLRLRRYPSLSGAEVLF
jgi:hypothetical protein